MRSLSLLALFCLAGCPVDGAGDRQVDVGAWTATIQTTEVGVGWSDAVFLLHDADSEVVSEMSPESDLWMPAHGHGSTEPVTVAEGEPGQYIITGSYIMAGQWEVTTTFPGSPDQLVFEIEAFSE